MTIKIFIFWAIIFLMTLITIISLWSSWKKSKASIFSIVVISVLLAIFTMGFYFSKGAYQALQQRWALQEKENQAKTELAQLGSTDNVILKMKQHLAENPESAQGWYLLGRLYMTQQDYKNAVAALTHAKQLTPAQPNILSSYAEASYFLHHQHLDAESQAILKKLLIENPQQFNALNLLAIDAYQNKHYPEALHYWQQILQQLPPQSQDAQMIHAMMQRALAQQGVNNSGVELHVQVKISDTIKSKIMPNDNVFIYAQAVSGPPMPLAVTKVTAKDLPISVTLDESMAMIPTASLANFQKIRIIARVSKSGQAIAQTGDWQGISGIIDTKQQKTSIQVVINSAL